MRKQDWDCKAYLTKLSEVSHQLQPSERRRHLPEADVAGSRRLQQPIKVGAEAHIVDLHSHR